jgi:hypothetical protein
MQAQNQLLVLVLMMVVMLNICRAEVFSIPVLSKEIKDYIFKYTNSRSEYAPILLFSEAGFMDNSNTEWEWEGSFYLGDEIHTRTLMIFTNLTRAPIRSHYHLSLPVSIRHAMTKLTSNRIKFVAWIDMKSVEEIYSKLKFRAIVNRDIFTFIGNKDILQVFFRSNLAKKIKFKVGIPLLDSNERNCMFLLEPSLYKNGEMELSTIQPVFNMDAVHLNGRTLKVSANTLAPYIVYEGKTGQIKGGTNYLMLTYASVYHNFTLDWDIGLNRGNGRLKRDGSADGMLGHVLSEQYDIAFIARLAKGQVGVIDLTTVNSVDTLVFLTRIPETSLDWTALTDIFTWDAWGLISLSFFGVIPIYYFSLKVDRIRKQPPFHVVRNRAKNNSEYIFKAVLIPYATTLSQSVPRIPPSAYLISGVWLLFMLNMNTCYNCNLSSVLTSSKNEKVPNSFLELDERKDYNILFNYLNNGSCDCFHFFNDSVNPIIIRIRERFMKNLEADTGRCILSAVLIKKTACIGWASVTAIGIARNATLFKGLKLVQVSESVHSSLNSIGFQRHSIYTSSFSRIFSMYRDLGLVSKFRLDVEGLEMNAGEKWMQEHKDSEIHEELTKMEQERQTVVRPFKILNVSLCFLLWFAGVSLSMLCCLLEWITRTRISNETLVVNLNSFLL